MDCLTTTNQVMIPGRIIGDGFQFAGVVARLQTGSPSRCFEHEYSFLIPGYLSFGFGQDGNRAHGIRAREIRIVHHADDNRSIIRLWMR